MFFSRLLPDAFILCYDKGSVELMSGKWFAILRWFATLPVVIIPLAVIHDSKSLRYIAVLICPIITLISVLFLPEYLKYYIMETGRGINSISVVASDVKAFLRNANFRTLYFGLTKALELIIPLMLALSCKFKYFTDTRKLIKAAILFPLATLLVLPIYVPQYIIGYTDIIFKAFSAPQVVWILCVVAEFVVLYYIFKNRTDSEKIVLLMFLSLTLLFQYTEMFGICIISLQRMPLQLCNIGAFILPLLLLTKNKYLYDFSAIANVVGVIIALAVPDLDGLGIGYLWNVHFILEHSNLIIVLALSLSLGLFPRLDKRSFKHFTVGFAMYFMLILLLGTLFNSIESRTGNNFYHANYMFMFDSAVAIKTLPFTAFLFVIELSFGYVTVYPLSAIIIFAVFYTLCTLCYFAIQGGYKIYDKWHTQVSALPSSSK